MCYVAAEMEREGMDLPLLIGGATTSKVHTAVKVAPNYKNPVVYVIDASRAVGIVGNLLSADNRDAFPASVRDDYERMREANARQQEGKARGPIAAARENRVPIDWAAYSPPQPLTPRGRVFDAQPVPRLAGPVAWKP